MRSLGPYDGPPVVVHRHPATGPGGDRLMLLHGLGTSSSVWSDFVAVRPYGAETYRLDLPWRVGDRGPGGYDALDTMAEVLAGPPGGAGVVVAHSFASVLLLQLLDRELAAGGDPAARLGIRGIVLISPFHKAGADEFSWDSLDHYLHNFVRVMEDGLRVRSRRLAPEVRREIAVRIRDRVGPYGWLRFVDHYLRTPALRTAAITVPVLVVCGADDVAVDPAEGVLLAGLLPDAELHVLPGCGHFLMSERPDRLAELVGGFLARLRPGDRPGHPDHPDLSHDRPRELTR